MQESICLKDTGLSLLGKGKLDEARQHMESALAIQQEAHNNLRLFEIYDSMIHLELACGNVQAARRNLELAEAFCKKFNINPAASVMLTLRARVPAGLRAGGRDPSLRPGSHRTLKRENASLPGILYLVQNPDRLGAHG